MLGSRENYYWRKTYIYTYPSKISEFSERKTMISFQKEKSKCCNTKHKELLLDLSQVTGNRGLWNQRAWDLIMNLPETLSMLFIFSMPQFPHLIKAEKH